MAHLLGTQSLHVALPDRVLLDDVTVGIDEGDRIGWAWFITNKGAPQLTWHNGGTGGYRSYLGFDRESGGGIIVLNDSANDVDEAASLVSTKGGRS